MTYLRIFFRKSFLVAVLVALTGFGFTVQAQEQTPWQTTIGNNSQINYMWPGYNTGFEFTVLEDGVITQLGGFFNSTLTVRLYRITENSAIRQVSVSDTNSWGYADIVPLAVSTGERFTVAVQTNFIRSASASGFGPGFPNLPLVVNDIRIDRPVFNLGTNRPTWEIYGQMWGQPDIVFVPGAVVIQ